MRRTQISTTMNVYGNALMDSARGQQPSSTHGVGHGMNQKVAATSPASLDFRGTAYHTLNVRSLGEDWRL